MSPIGLEQARARAAQVHLPAAVADAVVVSRRLATGRCKLPVELAVACGLEPGTEVVVRANGPQLLVRAAADRDAPAGSRQRIDGHGRLQLSAGHRQLLGVADDATVLLLADPWRRVVRIVDPALDPALIQALGTLLDRYQPAGARGNARREGVPSLAVYLPRALETLAPGSRRTYGSPLRRLVGFRPCLPLDPGEPSGGSSDCERLGCDREQHRQLGEVPLDRIARSDLDRFATSVQLAHRREIRERLGRERLAAAHARGLQPTPDQIMVSEREIEPSVGAAGREGAISAARWLFATATGDWLLASPAEGLAKPRRVRTRRRAFTYDELCEVVDVARATATDPSLVALLLRFHLFTGARQGEALFARLTDIDVERQTIWIGEKSGRRAEQPLPASLIVDLHESALARDASTADPRIFRNRRGQACSKKLRERIWASVRRELAFAAAMDAARSRTRPCDRR